MTEGLTASDVAVLSGNYGKSNDNSGWGGDGAWWIIILFLFAFCGWGGNGGFGNGGGGSAAQGALTREQACIDNNFQNLMRETAGISDAVNLGFANLNSTICNQQYDTAQMINAMNVSNLQTANAQNIAQLQSTNAIQTQIAQCCCDTQRSLDGINYNMATNNCAVLNTMNSNTRDIIQSQENGTRAILDYLCQDKISTLQNENQALRLSASQAAQNNYLISQLRPTPVPAWNVPNPYAYTGVGYGYGCGCNSGCGCGVA